MLLSSSVNAESGQPTLPPPRANLAATSHCAESGLGLSFVVP